MLVSSSVSKNTRDAFEHLSWTYSYLSPVISILGTKIFFGYGTVLLDFCILSYLEHGNVEIESSSTKRSRTALKLTESNEYRTVLFSVDIEVTIVLSEFSPGKGQSMTGFLDVEG